ncbi:DUF4253 domain-containing protein [Kitasatospora sp. NPDC049285]|uniref:DUF4253 domain-containing protein n=1 Tax=Kitasatospora sp. NPDC049285 TaxID=3157096 RepID=UPI0034335F27
MSEALNDLRRLLPYGELAAVAALLPPGRLVHPEDERDAAPVLWMSDGPAPAGLWERLHEAHPDSGLWPLLLCPLQRREDEFRPWDSGELNPKWASEVDLYDPAALLRSGWEGVSTLGGDPDEQPDPEESAELAETISPFTDGWPGPAAAPARVADPDLTARALAARLLAGAPWLRIGLVPAATGAEALTALGWTGPINHESDVAKISAVLLDWERRFGTRLVQVGFADLELSVAAPPADPDHALHVAAEHLAFCPDNIHQGAGSLEEYAPELIDGDHWTFWWD